jgi:superfamily II DNA or RNA helicase
MKLRPYQEQGAEQIKQAFREGHRRIILCMPTGSGKTPLLAHIGNETARKGNEYMVLVERKELLHQAAEKIIKTGVHPTIIAPGNQMRKSFSYVASVQTLVRREFPNIKLLIIDECHREIFDKIIEQYPDVYVIGFTATPIRTGQNQLSKYYTKIIEPITIPELIEQGFLCDAVTHGTPLDLSEVKTKGKDYDENDLFRIFDKPKRYAGVIANYLKWTHGESAICFNVNVAHSKAMAQAFCAAGIPAAHVDGTTPNAERNRLIDQYKRGIIKVICNCDVLTFGFDAPITSVVIANRATKSLALWLQMSGRGSRPYLDANDRPTPLPATGDLKKKFTILDFGTNAIRLGVWQSPRDWKLKPEKKDKGSGVAPAKNCPDCDSILAASARECNFCGYVYPIEEKEELQEVILVEIPIKKAPLPTHLKKAYSSMSIKELEEVRILKGYKMGWIMQMLKQQGNLSENSLNEYAQMKNYNSGWVKHQASLYKV